jgi:signal transduction histidine kinase
MIIPDFADLIAERIRAEHQTLASRWFSRLLDLLPVDQRDIFPTESLLDHIPGLILEIGEYLRHPESMAIAANTAILDKARELGALRHAQQASLHQLLREYQLLSEVLVTFVVEEMERLHVTPPAADCARLVSRLHQAVDVLAQSTVEMFVGLYTQTIADQSDRLEQFTRMAAHEWRQPLSALQVGVRLLARAQLDPGRAQRTLETLERNVTHLIDLTLMLESVARMHTNGDNPVVQQIAATTVVAQAARQLREVAETRQVAIRVSDALPTLTVDVGRLELVLVNLLSNAIKYSDTQKSERIIEVSGAYLDDQTCQLVIRDNGVGIPTDAMQTIFHRFTRAHAERHQMLEVEGVGLGLSIVDDCVRAMGGRITVESREHVGTTFVVMLPLAGTTSTTPAD